LRLPIGDRDILCIDWDERSLRILQASLLRAGVQARTQINAPIPADVDIRNANSLGGFIRKTLSERRVRTKRATCDVPRQDAVLTMLNMPSGSADELAAMVNIQISKDLPFNKDQAVIDFAVSHTEGATATIWVAAIRSLIIDHYRQVIEAAGLRLERIGLRSHANVVSAAASGAQVGRMLMVDVGPSMTEIDVLQEGRLVYSRAAQVAVPAQGLNSSASGSRPAPARGSGDTIPLVDDFVPRLGAMDALLVEVSRTIEAYRSTDPGARIDRILLAGSVGVDAHVAQSFEDRFGATTTLYEPPQLIHWRHDANAEPVAFSAVIGLALSGGPGESLNHFNFLAPKEPEAHRREQVRQVPRLAAAAMLFLAAGGVAAWWPVHRNNNTIEGIQGQIREAARDEKERKELMQQLADVDSWQTQNVNSVDLLKRLAEEIFTSNKDAYVTRMDITDKGKITLELAAKDELVASKLAVAAMKMKDAKGKPFVSASPGNETDPTKDPQYPVRDQITLQILSMAPKTGGKK
jgi:type IV pilus assembly protein PilM